MKTQGGVYKITCAVDGRLYIGSSFCISVRWKEHRYQLGLGVHRSRHLQRAWNKYGADAFTFEVLQYEGDRDRREALEQHFLDTLQPFGAKGFNSAREVGTTRGIKATDEQRRKKSEAQKGRRHSEASKELQRLGKLGVLNPQFGKPMTEKQKAALHRSGEAHPWFGREHSAETRRRLSEQRQLPIWQIGPDGTPIKLWAWAGEASAALGLKGTASLFRSCRDRWRKAAGFYWRYPDTFDPASFSPPPCPATALRAAQALAMGRANRKPVWAIGRRGEVLWSWESSADAAADLGISRAYFSEIALACGLYGDVTFSYDRSEIK